MSIKRLKTKIDKMESDMNLKEESVYDFLKNKDTNNAMYNLLSEKYLEKELGELPGGMGYFHLSPQLKERIKDYYTAFENEMKTINAKDYINNCFKMQKNIIIEDTIDSNLKWLNYFTFEEVMRCGFAENLTETYINDCIQKDKEKYIKTLKENRITIPDNL